MLAHPTTGAPVPPASMTDLYEITMAAGYWKLGRADDECVFSLFFREPPFGGGFTLAAGLESVVAFIEHFAFSPDDLAYLASLRGDDDRPLLEPAGSSRDAPAHGRCRCPARGHRGLPT
jgi:nicotinate phosphoribosyltransferase